MKLNKILNIIANISLLIGFIAGWVLIIIVIVNSCNSRTSKMSSPVEEIKIDSLNTANSVLVRELEIIDSVKNIKIHEVEKLDNDSTLSLFYKLLGK